MVQGSQSGFLAVDPASVRRSLVQGGSAAAALPTSPLKTRARGFSQPPSGRSSRRGRGGRTLPTGCRAYACKTASSRVKWPNRDPIHEVGFLTLKGKKQGWHELAELNLYAFVLNHPVGRVDSYGLRDWGPFGGKCCNKSSSPEWVLVGDGYWKELPPGQCTGFWEDCDGYTCSGGFYAVSNFMEGTCDPLTLCTKKDLDKRWTLSGGGPFSKSPRDRGSRQGDRPPHYPYGY